jgi:hypothetical protein
MTLYVLALNRGIQDLEIVPEGCSVIGCGFRTIPAWQIGQIVSVNWTSVVFLEIPQLHTHKTSEVA